MVQTKLQMTLKLNNNWLNWFTFKIDIVYYYKSNLIINTLVNHISKHNWNKFATADTSEGAPFSNSPRHIWQLKPFNLPPFSPLLSNFTDLILSPVTSYISSGTV